MQEKEIKELTRVIKDFFGLTVDILFDAVYECTKDEELAKKIIEKYIYMVKKKKFDKEKNGFF